jgi:hypothetical protein
MINPMVEKCTAIVYDVVWVAAVILLWLKIFGWNKCCNK